MREGHSAGCLQQSPWRDFFTGWTYQTADIRRTFLKNRYVDGNVYHGEFFEDAIHGRGRLTICPGSILEEVYDGEFVRGVKHGRGIYVYRKGDGLVREPRNFVWSVSGFSGMMGLSFCLLCSADWPCSYEHEYRQHRTSNIESTGAKN